MDTEFKASLLDKMRSATAEWRDAIRCFCTLDGDACSASMGLYLIDADEPALRALESSMFEGIIDRMILLRHH